MFDTGKSAMISECGTYRYSLTRTWDDARSQHACFIMLNPSTADVEEDDPTIRRCINFAKSWGCSGIEVVNLFPLRATDPRKLQFHPNPDGWQNDKNIEVSARRAFLVVCAWGTQSRMVRLRAHRVRSILRGVGLKCLGANKDGSPKHPLYLAKDTPLIDWPLDSAP